MTSLRQDYREPTATPPDRSIKPGAVPMADVTYYVALPFLQDEAGSPVAGAAEECQTSSGALRRAEILSKAAGSIGAVAFSRTGDPLIGEFGDARLLKKFGNVPDDLSGL